MPKETDMRKLIRNWKKIRGCLRVMFDYDGICVITTGEKRMSYYISTDDSDTMLTAFKVVELNGIRQEMEARALVEEARQIINN